MDWVIVAATVVIAGSAVVSAWLTWRLSRDNRTLLKAGTEPQVVAYLWQDRMSPMVINLVLENIGQGPARDVEFFVDADPEDFPDDIIWDVVPRERRRIASLLPQGERIERSLAAGFQLVEDDEWKLPPFQVKVTYMDIRKARKISREYVVDVSEFDGASAATPPEKEVADSLKKIEKHLDHFSSGFNRLHVETITTAEQQAADEERYARWRERSAEEAAEEDAS